MAATTSPTGGSAARGAAPGMNEDKEGRASGRARVPRPGQAPPPARPAYGGRDGTDGPTGPVQPVRRGPRPRWGRIALVAGVAVLVLALLCSGGLWLYANALDDDLGRTDAFAEITGGRPAAVSGALNILLVGTDSRDPDAPMDKPGEWRADTLIVMHIPSSHDKAYLVSIPRDLYVPIPENASADCSTGQRAKINSAFAFGGLPLAVHTIECFTDVRMDHVMAIDFAGFKEVTDALGGVDLKVESNTTSIHKPYRRFTAGVNHMNGAEALDWIRQRKQFPDGDFARMRHQQEFLRALMDKAASSGTLTNPGKLNAFLKASTNATTVDQNFSLVDMALKFRSLRGDDLQFLTSPNAGTDMIDGESVVVSDREKALAMYRAMASDTMADWVRANPPAKAGG